MLAILRVLWYTIYNICFMQRWGLHAPAGTDMLSIDMEG